MSDSGSKGQELLAKAEKKLKGMNLFGNKYEEASEMLEKAANHFKLAKLCASTRVPSSRPAGWECGNPGVEPKAWHGVGARHCRGGPTSGAGHRGQLAPGRRRLPTTAPGCRLRLHDGRGHASLGSRLSGRDARS